MIVMKTIILSLAFLATSSFAIATNRPVGTGLKNCDVGESPLWGISAWCTAPNQLIYASVAGSGFKVTAGRLTQVVVSENSKHIWGVNGYDDIYYRNHQTQWTHVQGKLVQGT